MAVLAAILPLVSRSSALALELYRFAAAKPDAARDLIRTAKSINNLALIVKQVGTIIKEDDRLLSPEVSSTVSSLPYRADDIFTRPLKHSMTLSINARLY
jgi:hypothetical protein